jgi:hypothetical protein
MDDERGAIEAQIVWRVLALRPWAKGRRCRREPSVPFKQP